MGGSEAIVSALYMHRLTGDSKYLAVFEKSYDFIDNTKPIGKTVSGTPRSHPKERLWATRRRSGRRAITTVVQ